MTDDTTIQRIDADRRAAMLAADVDTLDAMLAPGLIWVHGSSKVDSKTAFLDSIRSGHTQYRSIETSDEQYLNLGADVALIHCITTMQVVLDGAERDIQVRNILVWHRNNEAGWQLVSYQSTAIRVV